MGADPNLLPFEGHASPIDLACGSPNSETVELLLNAGAIANPDSTPHCSIGDDFDKNLSMLIRFGIDMKTAMKNDDPDDDYAPVPFQYAKDLKSKNCLKVLTDHLAK